MLSAPTRRTQSPHCDGNAPWRFSAPACSPRVPSFLFLCSLPHLGRRTPAPVAHCMMIMCMSLRRPLVRPPSQPDRTGVYCSATQHTASPGVQQPGTSSPSAYKARWQLIATVFCAVLAVRCAGALLDLQSYITPDELARERADYSLVDNLSADEFRASSRGRRNSSTRLQSRRTSSLGYKDRD